MAASSDYPDYFLVLDFEATCDEKVRINPQEVIEFPVICLNSKTLEIEWEFQQYVKPQVHPKLTAFCTSLTGITQSTVDAGLPFSTVYSQFNDLLKEKDLIGTPAKFCFVTCGDWDLRSMLTRQLTLSKLKRPAYYNSWLNIKDAFVRHYKIRKPEGMAGMLRRLNLPLVGRHHSGIDDCRNITSILIQMIKANADLSNLSRFH